MNIEDALAALRAGKKIWHKGMPEDEYYMACRITFNPEFMNESMSLDQMPLSIVWMKDGKEHPEMRPKWNMYDPMCPMINLLWLMSDGWKVIGDID